MKKKAILLLGSILIGMHAMAQSSGVESFTLVNWDTDQDLRIMQNPDTTIGGFYDYNIRANTFGSVGSVQFEFYRFLTDSLWSRVENQPPYALGGDDNGDYFSWFTIPGDYILTATTYSGKNGTGTKGKSLSIKMVVLSNNTPPIIQSFTLVDPVTDTDIRQLSNDDTLYTGQPLNIRINTNEDYGTVKIQFGSYYSRSEITAPFTVGGDEGSNYLNWYPKEGVHILTATPYSESYGVLGIKGTPVSIKLTVLSPSTVGQVTSFTLVDWRTDQDIRQLSNTDTLFGNEAYQAIRANASGQVGSIKFAYEKVNGNTYNRYENEPPFALSGDVNGDYQSFRLNPGDYVLTATPYSGDNGTGIMGTPIVTYIHVPESQVVQEKNKTPVVNAVMYPNPVFNHLTISIPAELNAKKIEIKDNAGLVYFSKSISSLNTLSVDLSFLSPGVYYVYLESSTGKKSYKLVKE